MFTREDLLQLLNATPFAPFRLSLSDGSTVNVLSREVVLAGRRLGVVGLLDPGATEHRFRPLDGGLVFARRQGRDASPSMR